MQKRRNKLLIGILALVCLFVAVGVMQAVTKSLYRTRSNNTITAEAKAYAAKYKIDGPYDLGSVNDCATSGPSGYGDFTSIVRCSTTSAQLFYQPVSAHGQTPSLPYETDAQGRNYQYVYYTADPANLYRKGNTFYDGFVDQHQHGFIRVKSNYISSKYLQPQNEGIGGQWVFNTIDSSGVGKQADALIQKIQSILTADKSPEADLPSPSQALANQKAPVVVYYTLYYCHSPQLLFLDNFCILPN